MDRESPPPPSFLRNPDRSRTVLLRSTTTVSRREQELHSILFSSPAAEVKEKNKKKYDVFVSFSREDTRRGFTTHLCHSLSSKLGISVVYKDELRLDQSIAPELLEAIKDSRIALVVLSRNYAADSTGWCLDELLHILRCRKSSGLIVIPIFFDVDPSDFRKQSSSAAEALTEVANLSGFATADYGNDSEMIREIAGKIWNELNPTTTTTTTTSPITVTNTNPLVGMDGRVKAVIDMLRLDGTPDLDDKDDVRMIGICGPAGSGKTTVAMAVYDAIRSQFDSSTYIASVGEASTTRTGLFRLQKQLVNEIGGEEGNETTARWPMAEGFERLKRAYGGKKKKKKKLLLVLDGVTHEVQLLRLGADRALFGSGSRVIVTCREEYLVNNDYQTRVDSIYETPLLNRDEARVLLSLVAFGQEEALEEYRDLGEEILDYAGGVPSVVEKLGRSVGGRSVAEWKIIVEKLRRISSRDIVSEVP